jgi:tetratricopeptide (TPR) repeat protein
MNVITLTLIFSLTLTATFGQKVDLFYEDGLEKAQAGKLDEAVTLFSKAIESQPENYFAWFNRGVAKNMLGLYEDALPDFEETVKRAPGYKKGYLNRGITNKKLTKYTDALSDFSDAVKVDSTYADAYYNRGLIYEMLSKKDSACIDFNKAKRYGLGIAQRKVDMCTDKDLYNAVVYPILRLTRMAENAKYGFTPEFPVKSGIGPDGGPANQRVYLNLLRDPKGKLITYRRSGSCCAYKSENGISGMALLDKYEITYLDEKGNVVKSTIYISFYDYEEPKILYGFKTVGQK